MPPLDEGVAPVALDGSSPPFESSMRAFVITLGSQREACSRVRVYQHLPWLRARGVDLHVASFYPDATDGVASPWPRAVASLATMAYQARRLTSFSRHIRAADVVYLQRVLLPQPLLYRLRHQARRLLFDLDDAIDLREDGTPSPVAARRLRRTVHAADAVLVGSPYLAARLRADHAKVRIIPSAVDTSRYRPTDDRPQATPPLVGWIGSGSTTRYLSPILPVLRRLVAAGACRVRLIGARLPPSEEVDVRAWSFETELNALADIDIGIMPLTDDEWARGKAGYKLLQYMALGIPAVASPVGVNGDIVAHGRTGHLAITPDEWESFLRWQIANPAWRAEAGRAARARVEQHYSLARWAPVLCDEIVRGTSSAQEPS